MEILERERERAKVVRCEEENGERGGVCVARAFRCRGEEFEFVDKEGREIVFG